MEKIDLLKEVVMQFYIKSKDGKYAKQWATVTTPPTANPLRAQGSVLSARGSGLRAQGAGCRHGAQVGAHRGAGMGLGLGPGLGWV